MTIASKDVVEFGVVDTGGGQITPHTTVADLGRLDRSKFVPLTGPVAVHGAEPGDALKITFLDFKLSGWGWSMITERYGILPDHFPGPMLKIWRYDPSGREPVTHAGARIPLKPFPGIIGTAPGEDGTHPSLPPYPTGGNLDMRDLSVGTSLFLPVAAPGGLLSIGDTHAVQGHGELAGTALESPIDVTVQVELVKNANLPGPRLQTSAAPARHLDRSGYNVTCGVSNDLTEAARLATLHMIELLDKEHQVAPIDAYLLCSLCGDLVISEMVNKPVNVVSLYFPRMVFESTDDYRPAA